MHTLAALGLLGVFGVLAACSSSGDDAATETTPTTSPAPTTTTEPPPPPTSTTPPTTEAPTTTLDEAAELAAQVEADFREADPAWRTKRSQDPFDAEKEAAALDRRLGVVRETLRRTNLPTIATQNYATQAEPERPGAR